VAFSKTYFSKWRNRGVAHGRRRPQNHRKGRIADARLPRLVEVGDLAVNGRDQISMMISEHMWVE
jgi:hypothetical protein